MHERPESNPGPLGKIYQGLSRKLTRDLRSFPSQYRYNLTISHSARFVWFRVAKVGTRSIFQALEEAEVELDVENGVFQHYGPNRFRDYFKFAFVRNPFDRFLSCFHDKVVDQNHFNFPAAEHEEMKNPDRFLDFVESLDIERCDVHLRLQSRLIDLNNIDFLGRLETFSTDLKTVFDQLALPLPSTPIANESSRKAAAGWGLTSEQAARVEKIYDKDIRIFGAPATMSASGQSRDWLFGLLTRKAPFYVISHERSGTHFAINTLFRNAYVAQNFSYVGDWLGPYDQPETRYRHLERFLREWPERRHGGGVIKSHCDAETYRKHFPEARVVYVLRDPRDTLVSFFHYLNSEDLHRTNPGLADQRCTDFATFLRRPVSEYLRLGFFENPNFENVVGRWASHVRGWLARPDVCVLRYEDLKTDFRGCVRRVCRQVGLLPRLHMQEVGLQDGASILPRKGVVGDWKNVFSPADEDFLQQELAAWNLSDAVTNSETE